MPSSHELRCRKEAADENAVCENQSYTCFGVFRRRHRNSTGTALVAGGLPVLEVTLRTNAAWDGLGQGFAGRHDRCRKSAGGKPNTACRRSRRQVCRQFQLRSRTHGGGRQRRPVLLAGRGNRDRSYGRASTGSSFLEILPGRTGGRCRIAQKFRITLRLCRILPDWWYRSRKSRRLSRTTRCRLRGWAVGWPARKTWQINIGRSLSSRLSKPAPPKSRASGLFCHCCKFDRYRRDNDHGLR